MNKSSSLSQYIADDLGQRLISCEVNEDDLTLVGLGERYGVSFTPIRGAIRKLIERQLLKRLENGRVAINDSAVLEAGQDHAAQHPISKPLDSKDWDSLLSQEVIRISLVGETEFLREEHTATKYGIGRTALRQILHRLSGTGLISHVPRRGWKVRPFETKDLDDFLVVREALECQAMKLAIDHVDRENLQEMLAGNQPESENGIDNRLHDYFISKSNNRYIIDFFKRNASYYQIVLDMAAPETKRVSEMAAQHCRLLQFALDGRWDEAIIALRQHIRAQRPIVLEMIETLRTPESAKANLPAHQT